MSASDPQVVCLSLVALRVPDDREAFCEATRRLVEQLPLQKARIMWAAKKTTSRVYKAKTLGEAFADPLTDGLSIYDERPLGKVDLNFCASEPGYEHERRWQTVIGSAAEVPAMLAFAREVGRLMGVVSGSVSGQSNYWHALQEGTLIAVEGHVAPETDRRLYGDSMRTHRAQTRLRRLYPITIIGPALWAELPPMPRFDPMPTIEDFGDAKLMRAWPTLCEPRDPAFLRANRELRAWLWPYTIQNPADHVDQDPA
jgi:hypothetical protein